ncbi:PREDICTED: E3 SUMO-protein ligase NSE2 [Nanorana parkeri]|uniref:E3 SUMO-protein ligase NSE2 n=1 Tax=Nanorana parkeri TaxID=125878 RepID=UPI000854EA3A|nr:PREDICTED: E3 SUMO-protein ligase NSE2 [Nanorana parkeri]XP_018414970.1 PREDICTED: E3 SUMO-protein ligase NSE2 [Nanorana parkeri]
MAGRDVPFSFSSLDTSISSLKNCQTYVDTGMDIATSVALDLLQSGCDTVDVESMESVMLEYAAVNRDLNNYIKAVEETIGKLKQRTPEEVPDLKDLVQEKYSALQSKNTDEELRRNDKFIQFKEQLKDLRKQMGVPSEEPEVNLDDDEEIAVTQSIDNCICPITQVEMVNPVKNKTCGHSYEKAAIEKMIQDRQKKGKSARCPRIGCEYDVSIGDLVPDVALKRAIDIHSKKSTSS